MEVCFRSCIFRPKCLRKCILLVRSSFLGLGNEVGEHTHHRLDQTIQHNKCIRQGLSKIRCLNYILRLSVCLAKTFICNESFFVPMYQNTGSKYTYIPILHLGQSQFLPIQLQESKHSQVNGVFSLQIPFSVQPGDLIHSLQFEPLHPRLHLRKYV